MPLTFDAIIFDLDGTLIHSVPEIAGALNDALQAHGVAPFSEAEVTGLVGNGAPVLVARALSARGMDPALAPDILRRLLAVYETSFARTTLYPGVRGMLAALAPLPLGICTNKPLRATRAILDHFGLSFAAVTGGDSLPVRKPDPAPLLHTVQALGARNPLYVGDSEVDAQTAHAAALPFALFTGGYRHGPVAADLTFDHHLQLIDAIASFFRDMPRRQAL